MTRVVSAFGFNKHKRFALRRGVVLRGAHAAEPDAMMIELSCDGCRLSGVPASGFSAGRDVTVEFADHNLAGRVHFRNGACAVVKFDSTLRLGQLEDLVGKTREKRPPALTAA
jgi:hypothetical protein